MNRTPISRLTTRLALGLAFLCGPTWGAGEAHEHGAMKLDVAIEGSKLMINMEAPLDNLLGFERAPRTDAERTAAAQVLARLRSPDMSTPLFVMDAAAQCTLGKAEVEAPVIEAAQKAHARHSGHADLDAAYEFNCAKPDALRSLEVGLFDAYPRIERIDVRVVGPTGQSKATLQRSARRVMLVR